MPEAAPNPAAPPPSGGDTTDGRAPKAPSEAVVPNDNNSEACLNCSETVRVVLLGSRSYLAYV